MSRKKYSLRDSDKLLRDVLDIEHGGVIFMVEKDDRVIAIISMCASVPGYAWYIMAMINMLADIDRDLLVTVIL